MANCVTAIGFKSARKRLSEHDGYGMDYVNTSHLGLPNVLLKYRNEIRNCNATISKANLATVDRILRGR